MSVLTNLTLKESFAAVLSNGKVHTRLPGSAAGRIEQLSREGFNTFLPWLLPARQSHGLDATPLIN